MTLNNERMIKNRIVILRTKRGLSQRERLLINWE